MAAINSSVSLLSFFFFFISFDDESRLGFLPFLGDISFFLFVKYGRALARKRETGRHLAVICPTDVLDLGSKVSVNIC